MIPTSRSPFTTGKRRQPRACILSAACLSRSSGVTVTTWRVMKSDTVKAMANTQVQ